MKYTLLLLTGLLLFSCNKEKENKKELSKAVYKYAWRKGANAVVDKINSKGNWEISDANKAYYNDSIKFSNFLDTL